MTQSSLLCGVCVRVGVLSEPLRKHFQSETYSGSRVCALLPGGIEGKVLPGTTVNSSQRLPSAVG